MASFSNIATNVRSMNGIIVLSDGIATIENRNITTEGDIITSNISTNDINLNLPGGRSLSVLSNLEDKASYTDVFTLSGVKYSNNNIINYELNNNLYNSTLSNLIHIKNNTYNDYVINNNLYNSTLSNLIYVNNNTINSFQTTNNFIDQHYQKY